MCGIAGIYNFNGDQVKEDQINMLTDAVKHRGPDGKGIWFNSSSNFALGHRRLSIVDTSNKGHQPMSFDNERFWITLNGEIYNFIELKEELKNEGCEFSTDTDTEVILAAYKVWGEKMLHRFNGMWAIGIYDTYEKSLFLSRDRYGVKPLYYHTNDKQFVFSSEVQAIHKLLGTSHSLNSTVIQDIAKGGFYSHGTIETYLLNVFALPGGYNLTLKDNKVEIKEWYTLPKVKVPSTFEEQAKELRILIMDACKIRMRSDVPIATCLSGGIDSGTITAMISTHKVNKTERFNNYTHQGFCATFPNTPLDESKDAERLAGQLNTKVNLFEVKPPSSTELIHSIKSCDGPMHSLSFFPIWGLYKHVRKNNIIVTLDGQGPDEMLGGYRPLKEALQTAIELKKIAWFIDIYKTYSRAGESKQFSSKQFARKTLKEVLKEESIWLIKNKFSVAIKFIKKWLFISETNKVSTENKGVGPKQHLAPIRKPEQNDNILNQSLYRQFFQSPLPAILQQYDRCSMANGVECRMPFMDFRIVEFVFSLPVESKVGNGYTKRILREATKGILPDETRLNKRKIGFNAPIIDWLNGDLKNFMLEQINSEDFINCKYFDGKQLKSDFHKFIKNESQDWQEAWKFWAPVHLVWWIKNYSNT